MTTLSSILADAGVHALAVLDAHIEVPVLTGVPQAQGDLLVVPAPGRGRATTCVPRTGVPIAAGPDRPAHSLHSSHAVGGRGKGADHPPPCTYDRQPGAGLVAGVLTVPPGAVAYLVHTGEHGANAVGPGTYLVRRQREQADDERVVGAPVEVA